MPTAGPALIDRVAAMPKLPAPYRMRDWQKVTRDYLDEVFDFNRGGPFLPLVRWNDAGHTSVWLPAYVGGKSDTESINYLAAVVSGSLAGLDMRSYRGTDWVGMATNFFNSQDGICLDWPDGHSGSSLWYDVFPNVLFFQLNALYPGDPERERMMRRIAEQFYAECVSLGGATNPAALPDFDHTGFDLRTMKPFDNGERIEPEGAAGIAWIEYAAWKKFHDSRFLTAADWCLRALESKPVNANPLYEVLLPYAVITAARMNEDLGRDYDVTKLLNCCFTPRPAPQARPYWGVITGNWNGLDVDGLVGSSTDGGGYAFAMNSFQFAGTLAPLARYDARYARDLGRWLLNLANAARLFYPNALDAAHQSCSPWAFKHDTDSAIAYEGLRRWKRGSLSPVADCGTTAGERLQGSCASLRYYKEISDQAEVFAETPTNGCERLCGLWKFDVPPIGTGKFLVVAAERIDGGHRNNSFGFSWSTNAAGPFVEAFRVAGNVADRTAKPLWCALPASLRGPLYVKVESSDQTPGQASDRLNVDAMAISYQSDVGPFAQGDQVVAFVDLVQDYTTPIVLYRPASAITDLGLYGSSDVGMLGGIIHTTDVRGILQWNLNKTDFFAPGTNPAFLYYNPYDSERTIKLEVGPQRRDIFDQASQTMLIRNAAGTVKITIPPNGARVVELRAGQDN